MKFEDTATFYKKLPLRIKLYILARMFILDMGRLLKYFPQSIRLVEEMACGYGIASFMMASKYRHCLIRAYDIDKSRIDYLKLINPFHNLNFYQKDVLQIERFDVDGILIVDLLHHLTYQDQEKLLKRIKETAHKNVTLIIKDMDKGRYSFRQFLNYMIDVVHAGKFIFYYRTKNSFVELFQLCGFKVRKIEYVNKAYIPLNHILFVLEIAEDGSE